MKQGNQETYLERESELEELLLRDKLEEFELTDATGETREADPEPLAGLHPALERVRGLGLLAAGRVRPRGGALPRGVEPARRAGGDASPRPRDVLERGGDRGRAVRHRGARAAARTWSWSRRSNARAAWPAPTGCRRRCSTHHDYRKFAEVHAALLKQVGRPPFDGQARRAAQRRALLRGAARRGAGAGPPRRPADPLQGTRRDERRNSCARRRWTRPAGPWPRVTLEDATAADHDLLDADGRPGRAAPRVHRGPRQRGEIPRCLIHGGRVTSWKGWFADGA